MAQASILIVEDDVRLGHLLEEYLQAQGFEIRLERRGDNAVTHIVEQKPDLVILDLMLPGLDGYEVCRKVRSDYRGQILMLTARQTDVDQIIGLELGADDYVTKPVEPRLLLARIRTLLRRHQNNKADDKELNSSSSVTIGLCSIDAAKREVYVDGHSIDLTSAEFDLLWFLVARRGDVITRQELYPALRGIPYDGLDRGMDIHISRIRRKIREAGGETNFLKSIRGAGYLIVEGI